MAALPAVASSLSSVLPFMPANAAYGTILSALLPVFLVMAVGFVMRRKGWLEEAIETGMMKVALNLLVPCLILDLVTGNPALSQVSTVLWTVAAGFALIVCGFGVAYLAALLFGLRKGQGRRTFAIAAGIQNYGFMALPVVTQLFPDDPGPRGLVFIHGLGVELAMWTVGVSLINRQGGPPWRLLINGPLIAVLGSLVLHYTGAHTLIPESVESAVSMLGRCAIPICLFMIGATIADVFQREVLDHLARTAVAAVTVRLALLPALILAAAVLLPLPLELSKVLVVQAGMPVTGCPS